MTSPGSRTSSNREALVPESPAQPQELTSFNLLPPEGDTTEGGVAWQLLSRVRDALTAATTAVADTATEAGISPSASFSSVHDLSVRAASHKLSSTLLDTTNSSTPRKGVAAATTAGATSGFTESSIETGTSTPQRLASGSKGLSSLTLGLLSPSAQASSTPGIPPGTPRGRNASSTTVSGTPNKAVSSLQRMQANKGKLTIAPLVLRPSRASALTSTSTASAHALARPKTSTHSAGSVTVDGSSDADSLGALAPRPSPWSAVPGFPLPRDLLADDARSIRSTSSRPRSEVEFPSPSLPHLFAASAVGARAAPAHSSAEAMRRLREGAGSERKFWLPDAHAASCGGCGAAFSAWRRRHHCRKCYLVFCASCASTMMPTKLPSGLPGPPSRTCDSCVRLVREATPSGTHATGKRGHVAGHSTSALEKGAISAPIEAAAQSPQAQFAASALFRARRGITNSLSLGALAGLGADLRDESRQPSPDMTTKRLDREDGTGARDVAVAPFRRGLGDEDRAPLTPDEGLAAFMDSRPISSTLESAGSALAPRLAVDGDETKRLQDNVASLPLIAFPTSSPSKGTRPESWFKDEVSLHDDRERVRSRVCSTATLPSVVPGSDVRARLVSDAALRAFRRSRLKNRSTLDDNMEDDHETQGYSLLHGLNKHGHSRGESLLSDFTAGSTSAHGLGPASLAHLRTMLAQCLLRSKVPQAKVWVKVLLPLILSVCARVRPRPKAGESADIRAYLKLKRVPGGSPGDSAYVAGVVLSKHVATKRMAESLPLLRPRVMIIAFPLEFGSSMAATPSSTVSTAGAPTGITSLDRASQERDYTRILVARIVQLRPNLLVVKEDVSRIAIELLEEAGVTVVWSIKYTALEAIARCCGADIITSLDQLSLEPRLGRCASLSVETYSHAVLPNARKSFMRFLAPSGLGRDATTPTLNTLSAASTTESTAPKASLYDADAPFSSSATSVATIILRGGCMRTLARVKAVLDLCLFVAHNLRLEECLARDEGTQLCPTLATSTLKTVPLDADTVLEGAGAASMHGGASVESATLGGSEPNKSLQNELGARIKTSLRPYERTLLSASCTIRHNVPYPLLTMRAGHEKLRRLEQVMEVDADSSKRREAQEVCVEKGNVEKRLILDDAVEISLDEEMDMDTAAAHASDKQATEAEQTANAESSGAEKTGGTQRDSLSVVTLESVLPTPALLARETEYRLAQLEHERAQQAWEAHLAAPSRLSPFEHQRLVVLASNISSITQRPCSGPELRTVEFYGEGDETLGRFLEHMCTESATPCSNKACGRPRLAHFSVYVHNETRVLVVLERFVCPIPGQENQLLLWSYCKRCEQASPVMPVSADTLCLSFAKYLELHFNPGSGTASKQTACGHDFYADMVRFFAYQNLAMRFHTDSTIEVRDVILPSISLKVWDGRMKNEEACSVAARMTAYFDSVTARITALRYEAGLCRDAGSIARSAALLDEMSVRAGSDAKELNLALTRTCKETATTDVLGLSIVRRQLQEVVVRWDRDFDTFERETLPPERDARRLTTSGLSRMFAERDTSDTQRLTTASAAPIDHGSSLPTATEVDEQTTSQDTGAESSIADCSLAPAQKTAVSPDVDSLVTTPTTASVVVSDSTALDRSRTAPNTPTRRSRGAFATPAENDSDFDTRLPQLPGTNATWRRQSAQAQTVEESSCTETDPDGSAVQQLVSRFEAPRLQDSTGGGSAGVRRPVLRRGKTDDATSQKRFASTSTSLLSDGDSQAVFTRTLRSVGGPTIPTSDVPTATSSVVARRPGIRRGPPSSYRLSKHSETESDGRVSRQGGGPAQSSLSFKRASTAKTDTSDATSSAKSAGVVRPSGRGHALRRPSSKVQSTTPTNGSGAAALKSSRLPVIQRQSTADKASRSHVSTIARHFDRMNREAEREREKQSRLQAIRARRAQPVAETHAKVQVLSGMDAVKDDESEDEDDDDDDEPVGSGETRAGSGGEAEDEADSEAEREHLKRAGRREGSASLPCGESSQQPSSLVAPMAKASTQLQGEASECATDATIETAGSKGAAENKDAPAVALSSPTLDNPLSATMMSLGKSWGARMLPDASSDGTERGSLLKTLSSLWGRGRALPLLLYPILSSEHFFVESPVVVREDEISSLIAFTLSSSTYRQRLDSLRASHADETLAAEDVGDTTFASEGWNMVDVEPRKAMEPLEAQLRRPEGTHLRFEFQSGGSRFHIRTLFTEQFDALRRACDCEQNFIQSLSRCLKWDSVSGGKSGSVFLKTRDDRFVIKEISRPEMESFLTGATGYFGYVAGAIFGDRPSTLAKIFGCYRLSIRNSQTGRSIKLDCLVMENLFYGRQIIKIFDLKGSLRNRMARQTDEVLLDENFVEIVSKSPLFVREGSKRLLAAALFNDSLYLERANVMDFSLVVGLDKDRAELVVGIIDALRTYTLDKKAESWLKEASSLGGGSKAAPTVIAPPLYRSRFLTFMDTSFLMVPDQFTST